MRLKKSIAAFLLFFILTSTAMACIPCAAAVVLYDWMIGDTIGIALMDSLAIHAGVIGVLLNDTTPTSNASVPLEVMINPKSELPNRPAGWSAPTAGSPQPTPPSTIAATQLFSAPQANTTYIYSSVSAAAQSFIDSLNANTADSSRPYTYADVDNTTHYFSVKNKNGVYVNGYQYYQANVQISCPAGYTVSGTNCNLSSASSVQKPSDGKRSVVRTGNTFAADPQDTSDSLPPNVSVTSNKVTNTNQNGSSQTITINADGTTTVVNTTPNSDGKTSTQVTVNTSNPDSSGNTYVTGTSTVIINGTGTAASSATPASQTGTTPVTFDKTGLATDTNQFIGNQKLTDIKAGQCGGTDEPKCKIDETGTPDVQTQANTDNTTQRDALNSAFDDRVNKMNSTTGGVGNSISSPISQLLPSGGCNNPQIDDGHGHIVTPDLCAAAEQTQPYTQWLLGAITALAIYSLWFTKVGGT